MSGPRATSPEQGDFPARLLTSWSPGKSRQGDDQPMLPTIPLAYKKKATSRTGKRERAGGTKQTQRGQNTAEQNEQEDRERERERRQIQTKNEYRETYACILQLFQAYHSESVCGQVYRVLTLVSGNIPLRVYQPCSVRNDLSSLTIRFTAPPQTDIPSATVII
ncbi:hypothetical protein NC653_026774 [Populus alba x Populus x berolinensis]|uniref:Uncharacterized protein n=1 Tax=Populus alba x Populus x berolinensis TaxID=444605 RepID=A0AAD6M6I9_9ROSI|nr:hypothetical protein NC653_026774 [Populus alba x Populus x berolinensis]